MPKYEAVCDISNTNQVLSKDHGVLIKKGAVLEYDETPERIKQLAKIGIVKDAEDAEEQKDENPDNDPADPDDEEPSDPSDDENNADDAPPADEGQELPDDREELKAIADGMGIEYAGNIGAEKLKQRIIEKRQAE